MTRKSSTAAPARSASLEALPRWDAATHSLHWQGKVIKHFKEEAPSQEAILTAFERRWWPPFISFRLTAKSPIRTKAQLRDAVHNLNRSVRPFLRFRQEGNGSRLGWEASARPGSRRYRIATQTPPIET